MKRQILQRLILLIILMMILPSSTLAQAKRKAINIVVPKQTIDALRNGEATKATVSARVRILTNGTARGYFRWTTDEDGPVIIKATKGRGIFGADGALVRIEMIFREENGGRVATTVRPDTSMEAPTGCLIWDLADGATGQKNTNDFPTKVSVDLRTEIHVRGGGT